VANKRFAPTKEHRDLVTIVAGLGMPHVDVAKLIVNPATKKAITAKTLRVAFRVELDNGMAQMNGRAMGGLALLMQSRNDRIKLEAIKFYLTTKQGWKAASSVELTGRDGGPIETRDVDGMTKEEKAAAMAKALVMHFKGRPLPTEVESAGG